ncbi:amino acid adenylation domain-containing protein [Bacillus atrophaeus]|uniref:non-ribosomal peptide synthetase n=5 Tax=Bacillus atrophaeus TaxID=1452 RepID=UPI0022815BB2|nr:non-ribosomal peptide synthetase [Bacillus atrophaeus]MCY8950732.1 amino acid adenylation domain-containing protein [Bacillus atrophaeus]
MKRNTYFLTHAQRRVWFTELLEPGTSICNLAACVKFRGTIDLEVLQQALNLSISRNDAIRFRLTEGTDTEPHLFLTEHEPMSIEIIDFANKSLEEVEKWIHVQTSIPFKLFHSPLYQFYFLRINTEEVWLYAKFHHIIMDGISLNLMGNQIIDLYLTLIRKDPVPTHHEPSYLSYIEKENQYLHSSRFEKDRLFWTQAYRKPPEYHSLTDQASVQTHGTTASRDTLTLSHDVERNIRDFCQEQQISIISLFMASLYICISRLTSKNDLAIGTYYGNRGSKAEKEMLGMFVSTLPIRMTVDPDKDFLSFVRSVGREQLSVMRHQRFPYNLLVNELRKEYKDLHNLVGISMQYQPLQWQQADCLNYETAMYFSGHTANELSILIKERIDTGTIQLNFDYQTSLFTPDEVTRIQHHLLTVLKNALNDPSQLIKDMDFVEENEKQNILYEFNKTEAVSPIAPTLHGLFIRQAALTPDRQAIHFANGSLTYGELDAYSNRLAVRLAAKGVTKESIVGILAERSPEMMIAVLAVLKAGGAYLPLDPAYPDGRLSYMLKDSGASLMLTQSGLTVPDFSGETLEVDLAALVDGNTSEVPAGTADGGSLAYLIYTSGSTGQPKGVAVEHRQAVSFLTGMQGQFPLHQEDVIVLKTSFSFDASVWQLFWWTLSGASVYLLPSGWEKDPALMAEAFTQERVTTAHFIPAMLNSFLDQLEMETPERRNGLTTGLKRVFAGGEPLTPQAAARFADLLPETSLIHGYGPTEATVDAAFYVCDREKDSERLRLPIGKPVPGAHLYILDPQMAVQPVGVIGELYIAGNGVARGYLNRPELTTERFLSDPFYPGERMYKTGDLARWLPEGQVEFLGRLDDQVKIRGYRIEPGEIESALRSLEGVQEAAVITRTDSGEAELCAYIQGRDKNDVRAQLAHVLPGYMIPAHFVQIDTWPITPSGKLDRKALPAPDGAAGQESYKAPRNLTEMKLARLWEDVLKNGPVGITDDFFDRGGHSLKATALISRIAKTFGVQVPLKDVFARPTIEGLASVIRELEESPYAAIEPAEKRDTYPVSSAQKRMYVLQQLEDGGTGYNMPAVLELEGKLDRKRLEAAFQALISRHESLRTSLETGNGGEPVQRIHHEVPFTVTEENSADAFIRPFDLSQAPLFRAGLVRETNERHVLLVDMHHIISDGVSVNTLIREFGELYAGRKIEPLRIQYKDYAVWQQEFKKSDTYEKQESYWVKQLGGELPVLELPADKPRPAVRSFAGDKISFTLDQEVTSGLNRLARENGSTLYMVLLAAYSALLSRLSGQEEIVVGSPIAGRPHEDLEPVLGMFVNTLALRTRPEGGKGFTDYLQEVRQTALEAYEHQDYPFEELVEKLGVQRDMSRNPLFDAMFILQNMEQHDIHLPEIEVRRNSLIHSISVFDLTLSAVESGGQIGCEMEFSTDVFLKDTVERWSSHLIELLRSVTARPDTVLARLEILEEQEKRMIAEGFNDTQIEFSQSADLFHHIFEAKTEETPHHIAIIEGEKQITYHQLNERANRLARTLRRKGTGPNYSVAILANRSIDAVVSILAVLKSGGTYIPLDTHYPEGRIRNLLQDSGAVTLLVQQDLKHLIADLTGIGVSQIFYLDDEYLYDSDASNMIPAAGPEDAAYIIYTSGTTGTPKGVVIKNRSFTHAALAWREIYQLERFPVRLLQMASFSFDVFSGDLARTLLNGGTLVICPDEVRLEPAELYALLIQQRITLMESTPALMVPFMDYVYRSNLSLPDLRLLVLGSDTIKAQDFKTLSQRFGKQMRLINSYGVTEATIDSSYYEANMGAAVNEEYVPIGVPLPNVHMYVLSNYDQIQPIGVAGELCIGGAGVAKGYHGKPELTKAKFTEHPFIPDEKIYRTGDQACWLPDGTVRFLGRMDNQVKIKGYRIEAGEIESVLLQTGMVKEAAAAVQKDTQGQTYLAAYIVPSDVNTSALRDALAKELPAYMVPSHFMALDKIPLTPNGKVDRKALPVPNEGLRQAYTAPCTDKQTMMAGIWEDVLSISRVGIHDSFFDLGGDSIKALQVSARLAAEGWKMTIRDLFQFPTIQKLTDHITPAVSAADQGPVEGKAVLTPIQRRFFSQPDAFRYHYNQSVVLFNEIGFRDNALRQALRRLAVHHDALRMVFTKDQAGRIIQHNRGTDLQDEELYHLHITDWTKEPQALIHAEEQIAKEEARIQKAMRLEQGPLLQAGLFKTADGDYLLIAIHHLVVDGVSWRILLEDLSAAYQHALEGREIKLPPKSDSYLSYANALMQSAESRKLLQEKPYWESVINTQTAVLPKDQPYASEGLQKNAGTASLILSGDWTSKLLFETQQAYGTDVNELLLTGLGMALAEWTGNEQIVISTEGHGREGHVSDIDISRTVGWFTSVYPVLLNMDANHSDDKLASRIKATKDMLRRVPNQGTGYGLLEYMTENEDWNREPEVSFNYLGQFNDIEDSKTLRMSSYQPRYEIAGERYREYALDINAMIIGGQLQVKAVYTQVFHHRTIELFMESFRKHIISAIEHCSGKKEREKTLSDFSNKEMTSAALSSIANLVKDL